MGRNNEKQKAWRRAKYASSPEERRKNYERCREYRLKNRERVNADNRKRYNTPQGRAASFSRADEIRQRNRDIINEFKLKQGCAHCGYNDNPVALDAHHKEHAKKEFQIGGTCVSVDRLLKELDKCMVLCRNCHTIMHYEQGWITAKVKTDLIASQPSEQQQSSFPFPELKHWSQ